jgi:hypothetical protein
MRRSSRRSEGLKRVSRSKGSDVIGMMNTRSVWASAPVPASSRAVALALADAAASVVPGQTIAKIDSRSSQTGKRPFMHARKAQAAARAGPFNEFL